MKWAGCSWPSTKWAKKLPSSRPNSKGSGMSTRIFLNWFPVWSPFRTKTIGLSATTRNLKRHLIRHPKIFAFMFISSRRKNARSVRWKRHSRTANPTTDRKRERTSTAIPRTGLPGHLPFRTPGEMSFRSWKCVSISHG